MTITHTTRPASIDEIAAENDRRGAVIERLEAKLRLVDQDRIHRGKMLKRIRDMLVNPRDGLDDAGDLVSFGSTNDADDFRDAVRLLEDWRWDAIMREGKLPDLVEDCRKANERARALHVALTEARAFVQAELRQVLECVCKLAPETFEPIRATMDPEEAQHVAESEAVLARVDTALEGAHP